MTTPSKVTLSVVNDSLLRSGYNTIESSVYYTLLEAAPRGVTNEQLIQQAIDDQYTYFLDEETNPYLNASEMAHYAMNFYLLQKEQQPYDEPISDWIDYLMASTPFIPDDEAVAVYENFHKQYDEKDLPTGISRTVFERTIENAKGTEAPPILTGIVDHSTLH